MALRYKGNRTVGVEQHKMDSNTILPPNSAFTVKLQYALHAAAPFAAIIRYLIDNNLKKNTTVFNVGPDNGWT